MTLTRRLWFSLVLAATWEVVVAVVDVVTHDHRVIPILLIIPAIVLALRRSIRIVIGTTVVALAVAVFLGFEGHIANSFREWSTLIVIAFIGSLATWIAELMHKYHGRLDEVASEATHDTLTGLRNRRGMSGHDTTDVARGQTWAVAMVDLDYFKFVNDTFGHKSGDEVLVEVATRLQRAVRRDDMVVRFGGEEFVILVRSLGELSPMVDRVLGAIRDQPVVTTAATISITASAGVALVDGDGVELAIQHADQAMYASKRSGRDRMTMWSVAASQQWNAPDADYLRRSSKRESGCHNAFELVEPGVVLEHMEYLADIGSMAWIETNLVGDIVGASSSTFEVLGINASSLIGTKSWSLFDERDGAMARSRRQAVLAGEVVGETPMRMQQVSGGSRWILVGATRCCQPDRMMTA